MTKIVGGTIISPDGVTLGSIPIEIELFLAQGFVITGSFSMANKITVQSGPDGTWSTPLVPNDDITPTGTIYQVQEKIPARFGGTRKYLIQVLSTLGGGVNQVAGLLVSTVVAVGGTYASISAGADGEPGYKSFTDNTAMLADSPKKIGRPQWVQSTEILWVWDGSAWELINLPDFASDAAAVTAMLAVGMGVGQETYIRSGTTTEGPQWQNSNNSRTPPWNLPWGLLIRHTDWKTTPVTVNATGVALFNSTMNFTPRNGRRYRCIAHLRAIDQTVAVNYAYIIIHNGGVPIAQTDTYQFVHPGMFASIHLEHIFNGDGTPRTFQLVGAAPAVNVTRMYTESAGSQFYVEDIGPAGAPT